MRFGFSWFAPLACAAIVLAASAGCRPVAQKPADDPAVVESIDKVGGKVARNEQGAVTSVDFSDAQIKGFDLSQLSRLPQLAKLELWGADVNNKSIDAIKDLKLTELVLENTEITDEGLATLAEIPTLRSVNLRRSSYLTDAALEH